MNNNNLMETFYLETPSLDRKNEIIDYINEFVEHKFEQALESCLNMQYEEYAKKFGRCPGKTFLLIRKNDNKIIGTINVRWNLTEKVKQFGGNIGYGIRPTERRKGYNKMNLYLALGGKLERTEIDPYDGILTSVYWINVDESLEKYKDEYVNSIDKSYKNSTYEMIKRK